MEALISVIVPVYKVEQYLDRCVETIVSQSYKCLEIILVDDGSPDACPDMCDAWALKDSRIRVIHKNNGGLSDARNAGLSVARGKYIAFVDSDDWISREYISVLYSAIIFNDADIAECKYVTTYGDDSSFCAEKEAKVTVCSSLEAMENHLRCRMFHTVVWNKLYRRDVLVYPFEKGKYNEDEFWMYKIIKAAKKLVSVDVPLYFYYQRCDSIMGAGYSLKRLDAIEAMKQRALFVCEHFPTLSDLAKENLCKACIYHGQLVLKYLPSKERKSALGHLRETYKTHPLTKEYKKEISKKQRIWLFLSCISFIGVCRVRNWLGIGL